MSDFFRLQKRIDELSAIGARDGAVTRLGLTADEQAARDYLFEKLTGSYVYVENGNVYRSPDALFINRELAYGAYASSSLKMRVFGEVNPGPRPQKSPAPVRAPMQVPKPVHRSRRR